MREVLRSPHGDLQRRHGIELVATIRGTQAKAEANGVVAALGGDDHADLFPPPIANVLEDSVVRRISHNAGEVSSFYRNVKNLF